MDLRHRREGRRISRLVGDAARGRQRHVISARTAASWSRCNAETGAELWKFDLKTIALIRPLFTARHFVLAGRRDRRLRAVVATTTDGLLTQVNAKNGELVRIGDKGYVDLKIGMTEKFGGGYNVAAPPAIFKDMAILAPATGEQGRYGIPGDIRGFDLENRQGIVALSHRAAARRTELRHVGTRWLAGSARPRQLGQHDRRHRQRPGVRADGPADGSELRQQPAGNESLLEQPRGARCSDRQVEMVLPDDASRHLRLGRQCAADVDRRERGTARRFQRWRRAPSRV
mgnify:CR=1 FL=1